VIDPPLHTGIEFGKTDLPAFVQVKVALEAPRELDGAAPFELCVTCRYKR
jgi:hypothetical protein